MLKKRIALLLVLVLGISLIVGCGSNSVQVPSQSSNDGENKSESINVKIAHSGSEQTMMHQTWMVVKDELEKDGVFKVEMFPNASLGGDQQLQELVQSGDIQMTACTAAVLGTFEPRINVYTIPFLFANNEVAYKVLDGEFGTKMLNVMEEQGFKGLGYFESTSYRELSSNRPIHNPDDLKGLKIRVIQSPLHMALWENLGASPTPMSFSELYTALQQNTVDAQDNPLELVISQRFYEVQDYITLTNHMFQVGMATANLDWYNSLTEEQQKIVDNAIKAGVDFQREKTAADMEGYKKTLEDYGIEIIELSDDEFKLFQDKAAPVEKIVVELVGQDLVNELKETVVKVAQ